MKTSSNGLKLIKRFEGCQLKAYKCASGVWTIGYGHAYGVKSTNVITQAKAEELLVEDLEKFEKRVDKYKTTYNWNQNEYDAMVSFAFNIGNIDQLTANGIRTKEQIAEKMLLYNRAGGKVLSGLNERRKAERELFLTKVAPVQPISDTTQGAGTIRAVQQWLNMEYGGKITECETCGKAKLITDGIYGSKTKAALVIALQSWLNAQFAAEIKVDGKFGSKTKAACQMVSENHNKKTRGALIVQAILYCNGYNPQLFTEDFNSDCTKALKQYQQAHELEPDGIAGKRFFNNSLILRRRA